jgi:hypothetical protein
MNSLKRLPSIFSETQHKHSKSVYEDPKSELGADLAKLTENFADKAEQFNQLVSKDAKEKRPAGGKSYQHIKSRYRRAVENFKNAKVHKTLSTHNKRRRLRPSSACSSPTKLGNPYEDISNTRNTITHNNFHIRGNETLCPAGGERCLTASTGDQVTHEKEISLTDTTNSTAAKKIIQK